MFSYTKFLDGLRKPDTETEGKRDGGRRSHTIFSLSCLDDGGKGKQTRLDRLKDPDLTCSI